MKVNRFLMWAAAVAIATQLTACGESEQKAAADAKANADLARIREIQEREEAEREAAKKRDAAAGDGFKKGAAEPIKDYKY